MGNNLFVIICIILLAFIIGRELACWYFKSNKIINLLNEINENTKPDNELSKK